MEIISRLNGHHKRISDGVYRINPCPVCGHKDHFTVYTKNNSYHSFSGCCKGGDAVTFLVEIEGYTLKQALQVVKGDLNPFENTTRPNTEQRALSGLKEWRNRAYDTFCTLYRATQEAKRTLKPNTVGYFAACHLEGQLDYITDILNFGNESDWLQLYRKFGPYGEVHT